MSRKVFFYALYSAFIAISACKESADVVLSIPFPKIKEIAIYKNEKLVSHIYFEYDTSGRLLKNNSDGFITTYTYVPGKIIEKQNGIDGLEVSSDTLLLNENGLLLSELGGSTTYEYDQDGYLVKRIVNVTEHIFKIENGNMVQQSVMNTGDYQNMKIVEKHEFIPNSTNTIGYENMGMAFYGKQNRELESKAYGTTAFSVSFTYRYEFDSKKRVSKRLTQNDITVIYTYND